MYVTKVIDRFGGIEMVAKSIDELCNQMDKDGYSFKIIIEETGEMPKCY